MQLKQDDKPLKASELAAKYEKTNKTNMKTLIAGPGKLTAISYKPGSSAPAKDDVISLFDGSIEIMKINGPNFYKTINALRQVDIDQGITWTNTPKKYSIPTEYTFQNGLNASGNIENLILWVNGELI